MTMTREDIRNELERRDREATALGQREAARYLREKFDYTDYTRANEILATVVFVLGFCGISLILLTFAI